MTRFLDKIVYLFYTALKLNTNSSTLKTREQMTRRLVVLIMCYDVNLSYILVMLLKNISDLEHAGELKFILYIFVFPFVLACIFNYLIKKIYTDKKIEQIHLKQHTRISLSLSRIIAVLVVLTSFVLPVIIIELLTIYKII